MGKEKVTSLFITNGQSMTWGRLSDFQTSVPTVLKYASSLVKGTFTI